VVKCPRQESDTPSPAQINACTQWLKREIISVEPKLIVTMGEVAHKCFTATYSSAKKDPFFRVWSRYPGHGKFCERNGVFYFTLVHPASIGNALGQTSPSYLIASLGDLCELLKKLQ
jgi:uracil-DNA glycosylase family 4